MPTHENKHRRIAKQRRQYTLTRTKAIAGFILSLCFSLALGPAFDKVARFIYMREKAKDVGIEIPQEFNNAATTKKEVSEVKEETPRQKLQRLQTRANSKK